jgi:hypothetical protein
MRYVLLVESEQNTKETTEIQMVFDNEKVEEGGTKEITERQTVFDDENVKDSKRGEGVFLKKNYHIKLKVLSE